MDTQEIIEWLNSDEGFRWADNHFDDATDCHDIIEITEDYHPDEQWWGDSKAISNKRQFRYLRQRAEWQVLQWTPDQPPEGGTWTKKKRLRMRSSSTVSPSK